MSFTAHPSCTCRYANPPQQPPTPTRISAVSTKTKHSYDSISLHAAIVGIFFPSFIGFVLLDAVWIGLVAKDFYHNHISSILKQDADLLAALLSWICIVAINQVFVLPRTTTSRSPVPSITQVSRSSPSIRYLEQLTLTEDQPQKKGIEGS